MKKSEELRQKLAQKHEFKPRPFKSKPKRDGEWDECAEARAGVSATKDPVQDFQARRDAFIKRQKERQLKQQ